MDKICFVVLNYNDAPSVLALADELESLSMADSVVVVDNQSTDDSWERLWPLRKGRKKNFYLLRNKKNMGYGYGNQAGIRYAWKHLGADYVVVANPDIHVTDRCLKAVKKALDSTLDGAAASAMVAGPDGRRLFSYWQLLPVWKDVLDTGLVTRRLLRRWLNVPLEKLPLGGVPNSRLVDAVCGSFFMLKLDRIPTEKIGKLFDPNLFLYCEEKVLGKKFNSLGLKTVLVTDETYVHAHSVSITKSVPRIVDKQKLLHRSKLYYYRRYLHAGPLSLGLARIFFTLVQWEVWFLTQVCGMRW